MYINMTYTLACYVMHVLNSMLESIKCTNIRHISNTT